MSRDIRASVAQCYFVAITSSNVVFVSHNICRILWIAEYNLRCACERLRRVGDGFATHAMTWWLSGEEFCRINFLNMSKTFANHSRPVCDACEDLAMPCDGFATVLARTLVNESRKKLILFPKQDLLKKQINMFNSNEIFDSLYKSYLFLSTRFRTSYLYPRPHLWRLAENSRAKVQGNYFLIVPVVLVKCRGFSIGAFTQVIFSVA